MRSLITSERRETRFNLIPSLRGRGRTGERDKTGRGDSANISGIFYELRHDLREATSLSLQPGENARIHPSCPATRSLIEKKSETV